MTSISLMKIPLIIQFVHIALSSLWNFYGLYLVSKGEPSQGPTASISGVVIMVFFGILFFVGAQYSKVVYIIAAAIAFLGLLPTIAAPFYKDPSLWTSPFWQWGGAVLNSFGAIGAVLGIWTILKLTS